MRRPLLYSILSVAVAALVITAVFAARGRGSAKGASPGAAALPARTVTAGAVTVKVEPHHIDASGAEFGVAFDTHSVDLGFDVARVARLTVNGSQWSGATWSGDGSGGHHRAGTLRFTTSGAATGQAVLELGGLPGPVTTEWTIPSS